MSAKDMREWTVSAKTASGRWKISHKAVRDVAQLILSEINLPEGYAELSIIFVSDRKIHVLNRDYRGKDKPTDVLSFPQNESIDAVALSPSLGDLVISLETAKRQSREFGVTSGEEALRLIIHGTLHLAGYDHENVSAKEANRMRRLEQKLFLKLKGNARKLRF